MFGVRKDFNYRTLAYIYIIRVTGNGKVFMTVYSVLLNPRNNIQINSWRINVRISHILGIEWWIIPTIGVPLNIFKDSYSSVHNNTRRNVEKNWNITSYHK